MPRLSADEARRRLAAARVARLATVTAAGRPHIVPVSFAVAGDTIYTAVDAKPKSTAELLRLANIRAHPQVAVLADHYADDDWAALWWARADGQAVVTAAAEVMTAPIALLSARYSQYRENPPAGPVIAIAVDRWTGWSAA